MIHHSLSDWDAAETVERDACARALLPRLPDGLAYAGLQPFPLGAQAHEIALYELVKTPTARFALVPGRQARLGFDAGHGWQVPAAMAADWAECAAEWDLPSLAEHLGQVLAPPRTVAVPPLLVEVQAWEAGWTFLDRDDPAVAALVSRNPGIGEVTSHRGGDILRVTTGPHGAVHAERADGTGQADLVARLGRDGWRLPAPDEWEHLCGGGAATLFRWGDEVPDDAYPTDAPQAFDAHRQPNAFGLRIAENPYLNEVTAAPGVTRGGDGGSATCGGAGFLLGWLPLATAYRERAFCEHPTDRVVIPGHTLARRVWPLG